MPDRKEVFEDIDALIDEAREQGRVAGVKEGRQLERAQADEVIAGERERLLEQGRAQGIAETEPLIPIAREEGRVQGVEDGRLQAELAVERVALDEAFKRGKAEGDREGFKRGRGEGYKVGWNDAVTTPVRDQKAK